MDRAYSTNGGEEVCLKVAGGKTTRRVKPSAAAWRERMRKYD
jgi:hypothetical protein